MLHTEIEKDAETGERNFVPTITIVMDWVVCVLLHKAKALM
jgi:hypothetical protein